MSTTVDNRVVQMTFNNKQFEKGVDQTLKTIDKLNKALKFEDASDGFENLQDAADSVNFKKLSDNVQSISDRFSGLGIIGAQIWTRIGNAAIDLVTGPFKKVEQTISGLTSKVENQIVQGGWNRALNLEKAEFMLKNLGQGWDTAKDAEGRYVEYTVNKDKKKVKNAYRAIAEAVDGTAFSLDEAASAAANFLASGVDAGEELYNVLRSVQGMSSIFSTDFNQVAGYYQKIASAGSVTQGVVTYMTQTMGAPIAELLKESLNLTDAELTDALKDGLISFETFSDVMLQKFGDSLDKANDSYEGVVSNVKSALSRIGSAVTEPLIKRMIPTLNLLRLSINKVKNTLVDSGFYNFINDKIGKLFSLFDRILTPIADSDKEFTGLKNIISGLLNIVAGLGHIFEAFSVGYRRVFGKEGQKETKGLTERFLEFSKRFEEFFDASPDGHMHKLFVIFEAFFTVLKGAKTVLKAVFKVFKSLLGIIVKIAGNVAYLSSHFILFVSSLVEAIKQSKTYNAILNLMQKCSEKLADAFKKFVQKIKDIYNAFKDFISENKLIRNACDTLKDAFKNLDEKVADVINNFTDLYDKFIEFGKDSGLFDTIERLWTNATTTVKDAVSNVIDKLDEWINLDLSNVSFDSVKTTFENFFNWIGEKFVNFKNDLVWVVNNPKQALDELAESISKITSNIPNAYGNLLESTSQKFEEYNTAIDNYSQGLDKASESTDKFVDSSSNISSADESYKFFGILAEGLNKVGEAFTFLVNSIKGIGTTIIEGVVDAFNYVKDTLDIHSFEDFLETVELAFKILKQVAWAEAGKSIASFFSSMSFATRVMKPSAITTIADALVKFGVAVLAISFGIRMLAAIKPAVFDNIIASLESLIIVFAVISVLFKKFNITFNKTEKIVASGDSKGSLAVSLPQRFLQKIGTAADWAAFGSLLEGIAKVILSVAASIAIITGTLEAANNKGDVKSAFKMIALVLAGVLAGALLFLKATRNYTATTKLSASDFAAAASIAALSLLLQSVSIAVLELVSAIAILGGMAAVGSLDNGMKAAVKVLLLVSVVAAALLALTGEIGKSGDGKAFDLSGAANIAALAALMIAIGLAVNLLLPVIATFALMGQAGTLKDGLVGFAVVAGAIILMIAVANGAFKKKAEGASGAVSGLLTFIGMAIAVVAVGEAISLMKEVPQKTLEMAVTVIAVFAVMAIIMTLIMGFVDNALTTAVLMVSVGAAVAEAAAAVKVLGEMKIFDLLQGLLGLVLIFLVLGAVGVALNHFKGIGTGLQAIALPVLEIGAGIFLLCAALYLLMELFDKVGENSEKFGEEFGEFCRIIVVAIGEMVVGLLQGLVDDVAIVADLLLQFLIGIVDWCADHAIEIGAAIGRFLAALVVALIAAIGVFLSDLVKGIHQLLKSKGIIGSNSPKLKQVGIWLIGGLIDGLKFMIKSLWNLVKSIPGRIISLMFPGDVGEKVKKAGKDLIQSAINGISSMLGGLGEVLSGVVDTITAPFNAAADAVESVFEKITGKEKEFQEQQQRYLDEAERYEQDRIATAKAFNESNGATAYEKLKKELDTAKELKKQYEQIKDNPLWSDSQKNKILEEYNSTIRRLKTYEGQFARSFGEQYSEFQKTHDSNEWTNFKIFLDGQEQGAYKGWQYVADMIKKGLGDGLEGAEPITDWMTADYKEMLKFWDINSPSKLAGWVGKMIVYGLGDGITDNESYGLNALATFSEAACATMENDLQPVITPVLDFASVQNGANQIGYIYSEGVKAAADLDIKSDAGRTAETLDNMSDLFNQIIFNTDSTGVEGKLDITAGLLTQLLTALSTQQLVLDTGAVVGGIAPAMDKELGMRSIRVGRRV